MSVIPETRREIKGRVRSFFDHAAYQKRREEVFEQSKPNYEQALTIIEDLGIVEIIRQTLGINMALLEQGEQSDLDTVRKGLSVAFFPLIGCSGDINIVAQEIKGASLLVVRNEREERSRLWGEGIRGDVNRIGVAVDNGRWKIRVSRRDRKSKEFDLGSKDQLGVEPTAFDTRLEVYSALGFPSVERRKKGKEFPFI